MDDDLDIDDAVADLEERERDGRAYEGAMDVDALVAIGRRRSGLPTPEERRRIREAAGLSQTDIGAVCGVDRATVARWETGERNPTGAPRERYCDLLRRLAAEQLRLRQTQGAAPASAPAGPDWRDSLPTTLTTEQVADLTGFSRGAVWAAARDEGGLVVNGELVGPIRCGRALRWPSMPIADALGLTDPLGPLVDPLPRPGLR